MQPSPIYFLHGPAESPRVVKGRIERRMSQHRLRVKADCYILADGGEQPIALDFVRVLGHEQTFADAGAALALVPSKPKRRRK